MTKHDKKNYNISLVIGLQHIICLNYIHEQDLTDVKQLYMIKQLQCTFKYILLLSANFL
jgi:hypothetical protein